MFEQMSEIWGLSSMVPLVPICDGCCPRLFFNGAYQTHHHGLYITTDLSMAGPLATGSALVAGGRAKYGVGLVSTCAKMGNGGSQGYSC